MGIKGYKVFDENWKCRGFQYEVGKTFKHEGNIEMCGSGFHFCRKCSNCFNYYEFNSKNHVAEVEAIGLVETKDDKSVTDEIKIIRELTWEEVLRTANEGIDCTGYGNTGNCNTGNWNTGNWNSTNFSSGFFNSVESPIIAFNNPLSITRNKFLQCKGIKILNWKYENNWWIYSENMTEEEKTAHPEHEVTGGYLKSVDFKIACRMMWDGLDEVERQAVREIPNFDADVFKEITGIEV